MTTSLLLALALHASAADLPVLQTEAAALVPVTLADRTFPCLAPLDDVTDPAARAALRRPREPEARRTLRVWTRWLNHPAKRPAALSEADVTGCLARALVARHREIPTVEAQAQTLAREVAKRLAGPQADALLLRTAEAAWETGAWEVASRLLEVPDSGGGGGNPLRNASPDRGLGDPGVRAQRLALRAALLAGASPDVDGSPLPPIDRANLEAASAELARWSTLTGEVATPANGGPDAHLAWLAAARALPPDTLPKVRAAAWVATWRTSPRTLADAGYALEALDSLRENGANEAALALAETLAQDGAFPRRGRAAWTLLALRDAAWRTEARGAGPATSFDAWTTALSTLLALDPTDFPAEDSALRTRRDAEAIDLAWTAGRTLHLAGRTTDARPWLTRVADAGRNAGEETDAATVPAWAAAFLVEGLAREGAKDALSATLTRYGSLLGTGLDLGADTAERAEFLAGAAHAARGDHRAAAASWLAFAERHPTSPHLAAALWNASVALEHAGDTPTASATRTRLLRIAPGTDLARRAEARLGYDALAELRFADAAALWGGFAKNCPRCEDAPAARRNRAEALRLAGKPAEAARALLGDGSVSPDPASLRAAAELLETSDPKQALALWEDLARGAGFDASLAIVAYDRAARLVPTFVRGPAAGSMAAKYSASRDARFERARAERVALTEEAWEAGLRDTLAGFEQRAAELANPPWRGAAKADLLELIDHRARLSQLRKDLAATRGEAPKSGKKATAAPLPLPSFALTSRLLAIEARACTNLAALTDTFPVPNGDASGAEYVRGFRGTVAERLGVTKAQEYAHNAWEGILLAARRDGTWSAAQDEALAALLARGQDDATMRVLAPSGALPRPTPRGPTARLDAEALTLTDEARANDLAALSIAWETPSGLATGAWVDWKARKVARADARWRAASAAVARLPDAAEDVPNQVAILEGRARMARHTGRYDEALGFLTAADRLAPTNPEREVERGSVLLLAGRADVALTTWKPLAASGDADLRARVARGSTLALGHLGRYEEALAAIASLPAVASLPAGAAATGGAPLDPDALLRAWVTTRASRPSAASVTATPAGAPSPAAATLDAPADAATARPLPPAAIWLYPTLRSATAVDACVARATHPGRLELSFDVSAGRVQNVSAPVDTLGDPAWTQCMTDAVSGLTFSPDLQTRVERYPWVLLP